MGSEAGLHTINRGKSRHRLDYHIVFTTKNRAESINSDVLVDIRGLSGEKAGELGFIVHIINGFKDHVHMLVSIPPRYAVSDIVQHIKGYTSRKIPDLYWQNGYGVFTVDEESFDRVFNYIKMQWEHHGD